MTTTSKPLISTTAYYLSCITLGLMFATQGPSLPVLARHTNSGLDQISLIFVFNSLGYILGSFLGGRAYDHLPGHRFMSLAMILVIAMLVLVPVVPILWLLLLIFLIFGMANGVIDVGCNTLLQWVHGNKVGPFMNGLHFFFGVGTFIAPLLVARVLSLTEEIHWAFWTIALICLPLAAWLWTLPDPPQQVEVGERRSSTVPFLPMILIAICFFLAVGAESGFGNWIYTYAITLGMETTITAAYLTSAFWGLFTAGRLLGVWVSTRIRSQTILFLDLAGCLAGLGLIVLGRDSVALLWAGSIGLGIFMASIFPTTMMFAGERIRVSGATTGWFIGGGGVGGMFLPWFIGQAFVTAGPHSMMTIIFTVVSINLLIVLYLINPKRVPVPTAT